jgi:TPR repeat protein
MASWCLTALLAGGCPQRPEPPSLAERWQSNPGLLPKPARRLLGERDGAWANNKFADFSRSGGLPAMDTASTEEEFIAAADAGQAWAQTRLGIMYASAADDVISWGKAIQLFELAAAQGDAEALYELAGMAAAGRGMPASDVDAFLYMQRAAEAGLPEAQYQLAAMFREGRGAVQDKEAAVAWGRKAAEQGHDHARFSLGCLLVVDFPDPANKQEGVKWIAASAGSGNRQAALFLATALARGEYDLPKDEKRSEQLLLPLAEKGDAEAQFVVAWLYMFGETFTAQRGQVRGWLEKAAAAGHQQAAGVLASLPPPDQPEIGVERSTPRS